MNFLRWCHSSFLQALLAEGMRVNVSISYFLPAPAIPLLFFFGPSIFFILPIHQLLMLLAVPFLCKPRAARIGTRLLWFSWHLFISTKKAPEVFPRSLRYQYNTSNRGFRPRFYLISQREELKAGLMPCSSCCRLCSVPHGNGHRWLRWHRSG